MEIKYNEDPIERCYAVLMEWRKNECGDYPATWHGLVELITDVELDELATTVEEALCLK